MSNNCVHDAVFIHHTNVISIGKVDFPVGADCNALGVGKAGGFGLAAVPAVVWVPRQASFAVANIAASGIFIETFTIKILQNI